ncbi:MAG: anthranilate phosphoribosyltransferase [Fimbriimonadaceae bacterium]|nr:anthranilate phosphoribosyltransferase [Fimbriimonadaceae bacterium]
MSIVQRLNEWVDPARPAPDPEDDRIFGRQAMGDLLAAAENEANHPAIAALLVALNFRPISPELLAGLAEGVRAAGVPIDLQRPNLVDTCGTGGGVPSMNLSTGAALLAAAAGASVAKHGNRAVTSKCGSADVLTALGLPPVQDHDRLRRGMDSAGFAFLFAPFFHPVLRHLGPLRQKLATRTVFNRLGPLLNPAGAKRQIIGVFDPEMVQTTSAASVHLGAESVWVCSGHDGLDEFSPAGPSLISVQGAAAKEFGPDHFGLGTVPLESLRPAADAEGAAVQILRALTDPESPEFGGIAPTAALAVHLGLDVPPMEAGERVRRAVAEGRGVRTLDRLKEALA